MRAVAFVVALLLAPLAAALADGQTRLASGLAFPVELAFRGDALLFAELNAGNVRELKPDGATSAPLAHVTPKTGGNGGFTGLAVDPDDARTLYVVYSFAKPGGAVNRVSKLVDGKETILLDDVPWADFHVGGRIVVGADRYLYVTTGDNGGPTGQDYTRHADPSLTNDAAQDPASLKGKVLRLARDGTPAGGVAGWNSLVYARGFRNPFGLAVGPDGAIYASENGITKDELDVVVQGANYGWPLCEGDCGRSDVKAPLHTFDASFGTTGVAAISGTLYMGEYNGAKLHAVPIGGGADRVAWSAGSSHILGVAAGPDGCAYVSTETSVYQVDVASTGHCRLGPAPPPPTTTSTPPPPSTTPSPPPSTTTPPPPSTSTPPPPSTSTPSPSTSTPPPATTSTPPTASSTPPSTTSPPTPGSTPTPRPSAPAATSPQESVSSSPPPQESVSVTTTTPAPSTPGAGAALVAAAIAGAAVLASRRR